MSRWSAAPPRYRNLPEMLVRLEAGEQRITGLDDRQTDETFDTEFTSRANPHRGYITIVEGCDKFCAYCVVPYTRGKERSRASASVLAEARRMADAGFTEIQLLGQNVNSYRDPSGKMTFAELLAAVGAGHRHPPRALHHLAIRATSPATSSRRSTPSRRSAITSICPCSPARPRVLQSHGARVHPRLVPRAHRLDQGREARDQHDLRHHRRLPRRDRSRTSKTPPRCSKKSATTPSSPSSIRRAPTPPPSPWPTQSPTTKSRAACRSCSTASARSSASNYARHLGQADGSDGGRPQPRRAARSSAAARRTRPSTSPSAQPILPAMGSYLHGQDHADFPEQPRRRGSCGRLLMKIGPITEIHTVAGSQGRGRDADSRPDDRPASPTCPSSS